MKILLLNPYYEGEIEVKEDLDYFKFIDDLKGNGVIEE